MMRAIANKKKAETEVPIRPPMALRLLKFLTAAAVKAIKTDNETTIVE